jgi:hypothetical protein
MPTDRNYIGIGEYRRLFVGHDADAIDGSLEWQAMLRQLERENSGFDI